MAQLGQEGMEVDSSISAYGSKVYLGPRRLQARNQDGGRMLRRGGDGGTRWFG